MPIEPIIEASDVRRQMLDISDAIATVNDGELTRLIDDTIIACQIELEDYSNVTLNQRIIKVNPDPALTLGTEYDEEEDAIDFYNSTYQERASFVTRRRPIISVQEVRIEFGRDNQLLTYPADWIRTDRALGEITIVPNNQGAIGLFGAANWLPRVIGGYLNGVIPQIVSIDYTAGYTNPKVNPSLAHVRIALAKGAASKVRTSLASLIVTSASRDGVSVSYGDAAKTTDRLEQSWQGFKDQFAQQHARIQMYVV